MKNISKKFIIMLGAIVFTFALANSASASYGHYAYSTDPVSYYSDNDMYQQPVVYNNPIYPPYNTSSQNAYYQQPIVVAQPTTVATTKPTSSVVNNYYYQTAPATKTTTSTTSTSNTPTYIPTTGTSSNVSNGVNTGNSLGASAYNPYAQTGNGITALSLRGSGSFLPSSIWQWILVVILILAIIVIARMFVHKPSPADHDAHAAHAH